MIHWHDNHSSNLGKKNSFLSKVHSFHKSFEKFTFSPTQTVGLFVVFGGSHFWRHFISLSLMSCWWWVWLLQACHTHDLYVFYILFHLLLFFILSNKLSYGNLSILKCKLTYFFCYLYERLTIESRSNTGVCSDLWIKKLKTNHSNQTGGGVINGIIITITFPFNLHNELQAKLKTFL